MTKGSRGGSPESMPSPADRISVRIVAHDLGPGGAARAAARIIDALDHNHERLGIDVSVRTVAGPNHRLDAGSGYPGGLARQLRRASALRRRLADRLPSAPGNSELHSRADVWTGLGRELSRSAVDVLNLHWLGTGTLSIGEIGRLAHPTVLTLHDMWAFCGAEHYAVDLRHEQGYTRRSRPASATGVDWDRVVWRRKKRALRRPLHVIAPSRWLAECARASALMTDWPVSVVPYPMDPATWHPEDRSAARARLGLPPDVPLLLFGADGGTTLSRKGADLLDDALRRLPAALEAGGGQPLRPTPELIVFGGERRRHERAGRLPYAVHHLGPISEDAMLRAVYCASDVMVVPSRQDNLPNTALEAQACGVPVVAFDIGGLPDIVVDERTGRIVPAFDTSAMADALAQLLSNEGMRRAMGSAAHHTSSNRYDPATVAAATVEVLRAAARSSTPSG